MAKRTTVTKTPTAEVIETVETADPGIDSDVKQDSPPQGQPSPTLPPHVANNILEFMKRVDMKGVEAFAFCEAYSTVQQHVNQGIPTAVGVPFQGLVR